MNILSAPAWCRLRSSVSFGTASLLALVLSTAQAQEVVNVGVSRAEVGIGETVEVMLRLKMIDNSKQTVCNLVIDYGDGSSEQVRVASPELTFSLKHAYQRAGPAVIQVSGKTRFQGLQSAIGCFGGRTVAVNVLPEDYVARRAAVLAEKEAALRQAEADKRAADAAASDAQAHRNAAQDASRRARIDRTAADKTARESAAKRAAAQREAQSMPAPKPTSTSKTPVEDAPKPKANQPKPKSSLDL